MPDEYIVSLPVISVPFYADITGDKKVEELIVSGGYDEDTEFYHAISINSEASEFEAEPFSYIEPYFVKTTKNIYGI